MLSTKAGVAALSVATNILLIAFKLAVGLVTGSVSILSEAAHSAIDLICSAVALLSVRQAEKPADEGHAFGHSKVENVAGALQSLLIFVVAGAIIFEAIRRLTTGGLLESLDWGIGVMVFSAVSNYLVGRYTLHFSRKADSVALEANAWHLLADVYTSVGVLLGLLVVRLTGATVVDPLVAIGVALFILKVAYDITAKSSADLVDASLPAEERVRIVAIINDHYGRFIGFHNLRSRKAGDRRYIDLHLVVRRDASVEEAHRLCDHLEEEILQALPKASIVIHLEPSDARAEEAARSQSATSEGSTEGPRRP